MEATHPLSTPAAVTSTAAHPLVLAAAASVTVLSLTGVAYLAGWLPGPTNPGPTNPGTAERPLAAASQTTMPPIAIQQTVTLPQEKPKVAAAKQADSATPAVRRVASPAASRPVEAGAAPSIAVYPAPTLLDDYLPYYVLLGFAEAWLNGAMVTIMVVYLPHWVGSFDDRRYILNK